MLHVKYKCESNSLITTTNFIDFSIIYILENTYSWIYKNTEVLYIR